MLNDNINVVNSNIQGEAPYVSVDSGQSSIIMDRLNDLMGTSLSLDDIESIMSLPYLGLVRISTLRK